MAVPWPPRNFVAECTTMSAPCSSGRSRYGVGTVLSTTSGTPTSCATAATASMSSTLLRGLPSVSAACPDANATAATQPSRAAIRCSSTSWVGLLMRV
jgi:hypothetical protein